MRRYILAIDQSTQGTKAVLFDCEGAMTARADIPHRQLINGQGWVSHDAEEIYANVPQAVRLVLQAADIRPEEITGLALTNQRETALLWDRTTGRALREAVVWQCGRGTEICSRLEQEGLAYTIRKITGLPLSPYFSAAKLWWLMRNTPEAAAKALDGTLCAGTMDSFLLYRLTGGRVFATDYSNACRTQLFDINELHWNTSLCNYFSIDPACLPEVRPSDGEFGTTDLEGILPQPVPIYAVMGDSHSALYGHGCIQPGMVKTTYGTGSSIMMNVGEKMIESRQGLSSSLAWHLDGKAAYVLEGNVNYAGAVISFLQNNLNLLDNAAKAQQYAEKANPLDTTYLVPAFTGLGAPYFKEEARASITGMSRMTGKAEIIKAGLEAIAYQIGDVLAVMKKETGRDALLIHADGGPSRNRYLMQFQSDIAGDRLKVSEVEELSAMGVAFVAGIRAGLYNRNDIQSRNRYREYTPQMAEDTRRRKLDGWRQAVDKL